MLSKEDLKKVFAAGFSVIRKDDQPSPRVKVKGNGEHEWSTLKKFDTKAARDRYMANLLTDPKIIEA